MTLIFRPCPEQQTSLPLGDSFQMSLSGTVRDSSRQVRVNLIYRLM